MTQLALPPAQLAPKLAAPVLPAPNYPRLEKRVSYLIFRAPEQVSHKIVVEAGRVKLLTSDDAVAYDMPELEFVALVDFLTQIRKENGL